MSVLFLGGGENGDAWLRALAAAEPDLEVATKDRIDDPDGVEYAIVGRIMPGELAAYPNLAAILSMWAGVEHLLADDTVPVGVPIVRMVEPSLTRGMVEFVVGHVLSILLRMDGYRRDGAWRHPQRTSPRFAPDLPVGIMGMGVLGRACAEALVRFDFPVNGFSRRGERVPGVTVYSGREGLAEFLSSSSVVVLLLPRTTETESVLNRRTLSMLPAEAAVINAGRGELIDDDALLEALDAGRLSKAVLDVFREEPLPATHPYWTHPKVTVTPHIASVTNPRTAAPVLADNLARLKRGEPAGPLVDRRRGY